MSETFSGRVGLQQRVLPSYRVKFLEAFAKACLGGLSVYAGLPLTIEGIDPIDRLQYAQLVKVKNRYFKDPSSSLFICWQPGFIDWLETWQPEMLIVEANPRYQSTYRAISWMHARGRKVIGWGLGAPAISGPLSPLRKWERSRLFGSLDAIIAYSEQGADQYRAAGFPSDRVYTAFNAVDPAPTNPPPPRPLKPDKEPTVLFVGRLQKRKRVDLLLQACADLPEVHRPHIIVVGDGPAMHELENLARRLPVDAEFTGAKHGSELDPYFNQADVFVLPGTGGLAIQQAMAHGLPVIVARGDGTQDDLVRNENGWQVPPDDLPALTKTVDDALSDPARLRQMGEASYRIVAQEINVDAMVAVFIKVLNSLQ
jgi:glycosyltransferase involved in cell wall biosynthesis